MEQEGDQTKQDSIQIQQLDAHSTSFDRHASLARLVSTRSRHLIHKQSRIGLDQSIHEHEVGHSIGFEHPDGRPSLPTFMDTHPYAITSADELHGRILYKRPNGSLSPDRDTPGVTIN